MVRFRVLFGVMFGTALMGLGIGYELGHRSRASEKDDIALPAACAIESPRAAQNARTVIPCERMPRTIRVQCRAIESASVRDTHAMVPTLTVSIVSAITKRTPYKVITSGNADAELTAVIQGFHVVAPTLNSGSDLREIETHFEVRMMWKDLRSGRSLLIRKDGSSPTAVTLRSVAYYRPELGQSIDEPRRENIEAVVEQMLGRMETPW